MPVASYKFILSIALNSQEGHLQGHLIVLPIFKEYFHLEV
jgi:hypothetical protein